ncbi:hypothetical protein [Niastella yeongjuensis]|nr:hypothetical protein [Niastella yeongjuensis]
MKNVIIVGSLLVFTATGAFAQDEYVYNQPAGFILHKTSKAQREENRLIKREKMLTTPNYMTVQQFMVDFPKAENISWKRGTFEEASFTLNGKEMNAFYDEKNALIGTTSAASYNDLPVGVQKDIEKHFKGYTPQQVILFDDNEFNDTDMELYGNAFEDEDNYFVEMTNNNKTIVLQVNMEGLVTFFQDISYSNVK